MINVCAHKVIIIFSPSEPCNPEWTLASSTIRLLSFLLSARLLQFLTPILPKSALTFCSHRFLGLLSATLLPFFVEEFSSFVMSFYFLHVLKPISYYRLNKLCYVFFFLTGHISQSSFSFLHILRDLKFFFLFSFQNF